MSKKFKMKTRQLYAGLSFTVSVPDNVFRRIEERLPKTHFDSVDDYVTYVLEEVLNELEKRESNAASSRRITLSKKDLEEIREEILPLSKAYP